MLVGVGAGVGVVAGVADGVGSDVGVGSLRPGPPMLGAKVVESDQDCRRQDDRGQPELEGRVHR